MFPESYIRRPIWTHGVYKEAVVLGPVDDGPPVGKRGAGLWPQHASAHYQQRIPSARTITGMILLDQFLKELLNDLQNV